MVNLTNIAKALNVSVNYLVGQSEYPNEVCELIDKSDIFASRYNFHKKYEKEFAPYSYTDISDEEFGVLESDIDYYVKSIIKRFVEKKKSNSSK